MLKHVAAQSTACNVDIENERVVVGRVVVVKGHFSNGSDHNRDRRWQSTRCSLATLYDNEFTQPRWIEGKDSSVEASTDVSIGERRDGKGHARSSKLVVVILAPIQQEQ